MFPTSILKTRHPESGKQSFRWMGPKIVSQTLETNSSKRRAFGTDITNHEDLKRKRIDCSKEVTVAMHSNIDCKKVEHNENITMQQQASDNSKAFVFGPFTPAATKKAGISGNKKLKHAQDWENLADTYRPQYSNKGT